MKLAFNKPCRNKSANHSQSRTSVLRPGTALMWRALTKMTVRRPSRMLNTGFQYTPVLSIATCVHPALLSQSPNCSSSSVIVAKVRISFRPLVTSHATTVLACTSNPQQLSYTTSIASSFRSWRENRTYQRVCSACSPQGWQHGVVPEHGSRIRLIDGLQAPRPLDLCHTRTASSVALGCFFFIWYGEAWPHHRLIGVRRASPHSCLQTPSVGREHEARQDAVASHVRWRGRSRLRWAKLMCVPQGRSPLG